MLFDLDGPAVDGPEAEEPMVFRPAHRPYVLVGTDPDDSTHGKRVTALSADGTPRRLLPHTWVPQEHHFGGPTAEIGESLVYSATVPDGQGHGHSPLTGEPYVVRRSLKGSVLWQHRSDHPATALATDGESVYAACNSGTLTALDAHDGSVRWHTALEVDGEPTTALCLAPAPGGRLLIGTVEGRILLQEGLRGSHA
ncbi:outer membrane protein assembly factor BamB family protein [Streptomyces xanthophaeus]